MKAVIEKQVIVQWYTPEERLPEECTFVVVTYSGKARNVTYDHALGIADWADDGTGWDIEGVPPYAEVTVHAWADLEPYGGE